MNMPAAFAQIALAVSAQMGGPFHDARILNAGNPTVDDGGSITDPGTPTVRACSVQIDIDAIRSTEGYEDGTARFLILSATLTGAVNTDERVEVLAGPHAGLWMVSELDRDPAGIGWAGKGRRG